MSAKIRTMGDLRAVLCETIDGVRAGSIDLAKADRIQKLAGQVSQTMLAESQAALITLKISGEKLKLGEMRIGGPELLPAIEAPRTVAPAPASSPPTARGSAEKVFCDQCDLQVTVGEAVACKSPFCKAKLAA